VLILTKSKVGGEPLSLPDELAAAAAVDANDDDLSFFFSFFLSLSAMKLRR